MFTKKHMIIATSVFVIACLSPFTSVFASPNGSNAPKTQCPDGYITPAPTVLFPEPYQCCLPDSPFLDEQGMCSAEESTAVSTLAVNDKEKANINTSSQNGGDVRLLSLKERLVARLEDAHRNGELLEVKTEDIMKLSTAEIQSMLAKPSDESPEKKTTSNTDANTPSTSGASFNPATNSGTSFPWGTVAGIGIPLLCALLFGTMPGSGSDEVSESGEVSVPSSAPISDAIAASSSTPSIPTTKGAVKKNTTTLNPDSFEWKDDRAKKFLAAVNAGTVTEQVIGWDKDGYPVFKGETTRTYPPCYDGCDDIIVYSPNDIFIDQYQKAIDAEYAAAQTKRLASLPKADFNDKTLPKGHYVDKETGKEFTVLSTKTDWGCWGEIVCEYPPATPEPSSAAGAGRSTSCLGSSQNPLLNTESGHGITCPNSSHASIAQSAS